MEADHAGELRTDVKAAPCRAHRLCDGAKAKAAQPGAASQSCAHARASETLGTAPPPSVAPTGTAWRSTT